MPEGPSNCPVTFYPSGKPVTSGIWSYPTGTLALMWYFSKSGSPVTPLAFVRRPLVTSVSALVAVALVFATGIAVSSAAPVNNAANLQPGSMRAPAPAPTQTPAPTPATTPATTPTPVKVRAPKPASRTHKARNVPEFPRDTRHGRRIVYDKALMTVWVMGEQNQVIGRYPVVGRFDRPVMGTYRIFSKSKVAYNPNSKVTFNHMMRFTYGPDTKSPIGLHAIPRYYDGTAMHSVKQLGLAIAAGGCVRLSEEAAAAIYKWAKVGDRVIVLPSP